MHSGKFLVGFLACIVGEILANQYMMFFHSYLLVLMLFNHLLLSLRLLLSLWLNSNDCCMSIAGALAFLLAGLPTCSLLCSPIACSLHFGWLLYWFLTSNICFILLVCFVSYVHSCQLLPCFLVFKAASILANYFVTFSFLTCLNSCFLLPCFTCFFDARSPAICLCGLFVCWLYAHFQTVFLISSFLAFSSLVFSFSSQKYAGSLLSCISFS